MLETGWGRDFVLSAMNLKVFITKALYFLIF